MPFSWFFIDEDVITDDKSLLIEKANAQHLEAYSQMIVNHLYILTILFPMCVFLGGVYGDVGWTTICFVIWALAES